MIDAKLWVKNFNDSLVFYRNLLGIRPTVFTPHMIQFKDQNIFLTLLEGAETSMNAAYILKLETSNDVNRTFHRIKRFLKNVSANQTCKVVQNSFGVEDPDGHKWIVTSSVRRDFPEISFGQCYLASHQETIIH